MMERIIVHRLDCPDLQKPGEGELSVGVKGNLDALVTEIHSLMKTHNIPFYQVESHDESCPGRRFPWEDLEFKLFVLEH